MHPKYTTTRQVLTVALLVLSEHLAQTSVRTSTQTSVSTSVLLSESSSSVSASGSAGGSAARLESRLESGLESRLESATSVSVGVVEECMEVACLALFNLARGYVWRERRAILVWTHIHYNNYTRYTPLLPYTHRCTPVMYMYIHHIYPWHTSTHPIYAVYTP